MINQAEFKKPFLKYSSAQVSDLFVHSSRVADSFKCNPDIVFPAPLSHDASSIIYAYHVLPKSVLDLWREDNVGLSLFHKIGMALACIHRYGKDFPLLHSDYVLHNLFYGGDKLYVIDAHPPELLEYRESLIYGPAERDICWFYLNLIANRPIQKSIFRLYQIIEAMKAFKGGYVGLYPYPSLSIGCLNACLNDLVYLRRKTGFTKVRATFYYIILLFLFCFCVWCADAHK